jgi:hypothetical protein
MSSLPDEGEWVRVIKASRRYVTRCFFGLRIAYSLPNLYR